MSSKKGVTLVALVVTIVVLLILAGVSITATIGKNGVITKTQKAKSDTEEAEAREELEQAIGAAQADFSQYWMDHVNSTFLETLDGTGDITLKSSNYTIAYSKENKQGTIKKTEGDGLTYSFTLGEISDSNMGAKIVSFEADGGE